MFSGTAGLKGRTICVVQGSPVTALKRSPIGQTAGGVETQDKPVTALKISPAWQAGGMMFGGGGAIVFLLLLPPLPEEDVASLVVNVPSAE